MRIRWWLAPSIALVAFAATRCGGDESATDSTGAAGSGGASGAGSGSAGKGGSATSSTTGSAGKGGSTTGSGGKGGSSGGSAGSTGAGGSAGSTGAGGTTGGSAGRGGSGGSKADAAADSGGGTDASTDGPLSDAPARDVMGDVTSGDVTPIDSTTPPDTTPSNEGGGDTSISDAAPDAGACPATQPAQGTPCTGGGICSYGQAFCGCVAGGADGGRQWICRLPPEAAVDPDCPGTKPTGGTSCADAGTGTVCRYGPGSGCICNQMDEWFCLPP